MLCLARLFTTCLKRCLGHSPLSIFNRNFPTHPPHLGLLLPFPAPEHCYKNWNPECPATRFKVPKVVRRGCKGCFEFPRSTSEKSLRSREMTAALCSPRHWKWSLIGRPCGGFVNSSILTPEWQVAGASVIFWLILSKHSRSEKLPIPRGMPQIHESLHQPCRYSP